MSRPTATPPESTDGPRTLYISADVFDPATGRMETVDCWIITAMPGSRRDITRSVARILAEHADNMPNDDAEHTTSVTYDPEHRPRL